MKSFQLLLFVFREVVFSFGRTPAALVVFFLVAGFDVPLTFLKVGPFDDDSVEVDLEMMAVVVWVVMSPGSHSKQTTLWKGLGDSSTYFPTQIA